MIESPKDFCACGFAKTCEHQVKYDMNARDNCYYQQGREDAIEECIEAIRNRKCNKINCYDFSCSECTERILRELK